MKTKSAVKFLPCILLVFFFLATNVKAQEIEIKGIVKAEFDYESEPLQEVNVYLKDTSIGTTTNKKGEFTFPRKLSVGDVLVFSYLGFTKKQVKIRANSTFLTVILEEDSNTLLGALNTKKRYKSKKPKQ